MRLYEISGEIARLNEELEDNGGELLPYMEERLSVLNMSMEQKAEGIGGLVLNEQSDLNIIKGQIEGVKKTLEELIAKERVIENRINRWKAYLKINMNHAGIEKIDCGPFKIRIQKNGGKPPIEITNDAAVPARFITIIPARTEIDMEKIREAANAGEDVSAFAKLEAGTHIRIS